MPIWSISYFPAEGERNSPITGLKTLLTKDEQANFTERFGKMSELEMTEWNHDWRKKIDGYYQLTSGNFRAYYTIKGRNITILYVCRKHSQKADRRRDLASVERNLISYLKQSGGR